MFWFIIILVVVAIAAGSFYAVRYASRRADDISEGHAASMAFMNECESRILSMQMDPANIDHAQALGKLHELIKFSDKAGSSELDWKIDPVLSRLDMALSGTQGENPAEVIAEVTTLFERRKIEIRESKRGKF